MELELSGAAGACDEATVDVAGWTITGLDDCAGNMLATAKIARDDRMLARILLLTSPSGGVDSRYPNIFCDRGKLRVNLGLVLRDRDLLELHFFDNRKDLLNLWLAGARRLFRGGRRDGHEQG